MHQSIGHKLDFLKTLSIISAPYGLKNMTLKIYLHLRKIINATHKLRET